MKRVIKNLVLVLFAGMLMTACEKEYTITVKSNNDNYGKAIGGGTYDKDTQLQIAAVAYSGYKFERWDDGNTENPRTVKVTGDATYTAIFVENNGDTPGTDPSDPPAEGVVMHVTFGDEEWDATLILKVVTPSPDNSKTYYRLSIYEDASGAGPVCAIMMNPEVGSSVASDFEYNAAAYLDNGQDYVEVNGTSYPHYLSMGDYSINVTELDMEANTVSCTVDADLLDMSREATGESRQFTHLHVELEKAYMNNYGKGNVKNNSYNR